MQLNGSCCASPAQLSSCRQATSLLHLIHLLSPLPDLRPARPQPLPASPSELAYTLVVVAVRNPFDWAAALHRLCYCCSRMQPGA